MAAPFLLLKCDPCVFFQNFLFTFFIQNLKFQNILEEFKMTWLIKYKIRKYIRSVMRPMNPEQAQKWLFRTRMVYLASGFLCLSTSYYFYKKNEDVAAKYKGMIFIIFSLKLNFLILIFLFQNLIHHIPIVNFENVIT